MYIKGIGAIKNDVYSKPSHMLAYQAICAALKDASMSINNIDVIVLSNVEWFFNGESQRHMPSLLSSLLKVRIPIIRTTAACASGGAAFWFANKLPHNNILVVGTEKLIAKSSEAITEEFLMAADNIWDQKEGLNFPSQNALVAQEYFNKYDANSDDLALIALKNHENAFLNPKAYFHKKKVTLEKIKNSPIVASPLRLFDCSISTDGAAAAILSKDKTDIKVVGSSLSTDYISTFERENMATWNATVSAAKEAYAQAGISAEDIDFAEVHDAFTIVELIAYEDLGFCKKGEGAKMIREGIVKLDGKLPVNPSGGLKAKGHPVSVTGLSQIYEITKQLRKEANDLQINNPKIGLAQNIGGAGATITVNILKKIAG